MIHLNESVVNLLDTKSDNIKEKYIDQVWDILQNAYKSQGGIKGNGFKNKQDMLNIPFWKLDVVDGKVLCVVMYKFTPTKQEGAFVRKMCSLGIVSDESRDLARTKLKNILKYELERSLMEVSGLLNDYMKKNFPEQYKKFLIPVDVVKDLLNKDDVESIDKFRYTRTIGGDSIEKVMLGTPAKKY